MAQCFIDNLDDSRLAPYRGIVAQSFNPSKDLFVAEGQWIVERLLSSRFSVESVLVVRGREETWKPDLPEETDVLVVEPEAVNQLVGFEFHRGIMAAGRREPMPQASTSVAGGLPSETNRAVWLVCPRLADPQNLGSLIRSATALGAIGLILGPNSCDPFSRKCIRVSAGQVFQLPIIQPNDLAYELGRLRENGFEWIATVPSDSGAELDSRHDSEALETASGTLPDRICLFLGSEDFGLEDQWLPLMDRCLHIPMSRSVDSLNVSIAGAILLYEICCRG